MSKKRKKIYNDPLSPEVQEQKTNAKKSIQQLYAKSLTKEQLGASLKKFYEAYESWNEPNVPLKVVGTHNATAMTVHPYSSHHYTNTTTVTGPWSFYTYKPSTSTNATITFDLPSPKKNKCYKKKD